MLATQFMMSKTRYNDFCHLFNDNVNFGNSTFHLSGIYHRFSHGYQHLCIQVK